MVNAIDMGNYYRIPADNRNLNYQKYENAGNADLDEIEEYNSHNTQRLTIKEMEYCFDYYYYFDSCYYYSN